MKKSLVILSLLFSGLVNAQSEVFSVNIECDRQCLADFLETYLEALVNHEPNALPVTRNVKYTENGVQVNLGDGLWQTASEMPGYRLDVIDEEAGAVGMLGRINEGGNNNWFAVRLKVEKGESISEIETLVNRSVGGGGFGGTPYTEPHSLMSEEIPEQRLSRAQLTSIGNSYFTGLDTDNHGGNVPFSPDCQRRENGNVMANNSDAEPGSMLWMGCKAQFDTGFSVIVTDIRERRFEVVDPVKGLAFGWGYFDHNGSVERFSNTPDDTMTDVNPIFRQPFSFYIAEIFKVMDGQIRQIEAVLATVPYKMESGW